MRRQALRLDPLRLLALAFTLAVGAGVAEHREPVLVDVAQAVVVEAVAQLPARRARGRRALRGVAGAGAAHDARARARAHAGAARRAEASEALVLELFRDRPRDQISRWTKTPLEMLRDRILIN